MSRGPPIREQPPAPVGGSCAVNDPTFWAPCSVRAGGLRPLLPFCARRSLGAVSASYHVLPPHVSRRASRATAQRRHRRDGVVAGPPGVTRGGDAARTDLRGGVPSTRTLVLAPHPGSAQDRPHALAFPLTRNTDCTTPETVLLAPRDWVHVLSWIEYKEDRGETLLNDVLPRYDDPVICYVRRQTFSTASICGGYSANTPRCHHRRPLYENPFFVPPSGVSAVQVRDEAATPPKAYRG